jgi:hypothetical protein
MKIPATSHLPTHWNSTGQSELTADRLAVRHSRYVPNLQGFHQPSLRPVLNLKFTPRQPALSDDGLERAQPKLRMIRNRNRDGCVRKSLLHNDVTSMLANLQKAVSLEDIASLPPGKNANFTQPQPLLG